MTSALPRVESVLRPESRSYLSGYDAEEDSAIVVDFGRRGVLIAARGIVRCSVWQVHRLGPLTLTAQPDGFRLTCPGLELVARAFAAFEEESLIAASVPAGSSVEAVGLVTLPKLWDRLHIDLADLPRGGLQMRLEGSQSQGWIWSIYADGTALFRSEPLSLSDLEFELHDLLRDDTRLTPSLEPLPPAEVFALLHGFFGGSRFDELEATAREQTWAKHRVSPRAPSSLNHRLYLVSRANGTDDLLVEQADGFQRIVLRTGEFDEEVRRISEKVRRAVESL